VREGGDVKFKATEQPPDELPAPRVRAHGTGESPAHVTWLEPLEGTPRLLTTLFTRGDRGSILVIAKPRLLNLDRTPACFVNPLRGKTTNWRAGCGRSARPVRREGEPKPMGSPYPYPGKSREDVFIFSPLRRGG